MKKGLILILFAFAFSAQSQTVGYFGKRIFTDLSIGVVPYFCKDFEINDDYFHSGSFLKVGFHFNSSIAYICSDNISIGTQFSYFHTAASIIHAHETSIEDTSYSAHLVYDSKTITQFIEWHNRTPYPVIDNYFRLGLCVSFISNIKYKDFFGRTDYISLPSNIELAQEFSALENGQKAVLPGLYYEFGNRIPLSKKVLINLNVSGFIMPIRSLNYDNFNSFKNYRTDTFIEDLGKKRVSNSNWLRLQLGVTMLL